MKKKWKAIPRGWKLAIDLTLLALLLAVAWILRGFPSLTASSAFRRSCRDAGLNAPDMELRVGNFGISADGARSYVSDLMDLGEEWQSWDVWTIPAADGICYAPLDFENSVDDGWITESDLEKPIPLFAVKAPGADAKLTLTIEPCTTYQYSYDGDERLAHNWQGGRFPLLLTEAKNGWFVFELDRDELRAHVNETNSCSDAEEPYTSYLRWVYAFYRDNMCACPVRLELTTYDESGDVVQTASWEPVSPNTQEHLDRNGNVLPRVAP